MNACALLDILELAKRAALEFTIRVKKTVSALQIRSVFANGANVCPLSYRTARIANIHVIGINADRMQSAVWVPTVLSVDANPVALEIQTLDVKT
jgi:hypothetical protein